MINFRFHLISLVAVFLSLAIGIVVGSTVIDRAIVEGLNNRIDTAERNSIERRIQNDQLRDELNQQNSQSIILATHAVRGYLDGHTVFLMTIGNVSDNSRVEILELASVANARKGGVIRFREDFITQDKEQIAQSLIELENVGALLGEEQDTNRQIIRTLQHSLTLQAGGENELPINFDNVINVLANNNVLTLEERNNEVEPFLPISFIVLIDRAIFENDAAVEFIQALYSDYPLTIGLEGGNDRPSRENAIDLLGDQRSSISVVDNVESPNGRAALIIAHAQNLAGERQIFGVSSRAQSPAPVLLDR